MLPETTYRSGFCANCVVEQAVRMAAIEQVEDVRVLQARGSADLGEIAFAAERGAEVGVEDPDGDGAFVFDVVGEVDGRHSADAEFADDSLAVGDLLGAPALSDSFGLELALTARHSRRVIDPAFSFLFIGHLHPETRVRGFPRNTVNPICVFHDSNGLRFIRVHRTTDILVSHSACPPCMTTAECAKHSLVELQPQYDALMPTTSAPSTER